MYPSDVYDHPLARELLGPIPLLADLPPSLPSTRLGFASQPPISSLGLVPTFDLDSTYDLDRASLPDDLGEVYYETFGGTKLPKRYPPLPKSTGKKGPERQDVQRVVDWIGGVDDGAFILHQACEKLLIHQ